MTQAFTISAARTEGSPSPGDRMQVRKIHRLCFSDNEEMCAKGLRDLARGLGTDSVTNQQPADYAENRAELKEKGVEDRLLLLAHSDNPVYRELAVAALGTWLGDKALAAVLKACEDDEVMVRATAIGALEGWPDCEEGYELLLIAAEDAKWSVRMQAARALRPYPGADAEEALFELLVDPNANVRYSASEALRQRDRSSVLPRLRTFFDHPAPHLFDAAFDLIGDIGDESDTKFLDKVGSFFNFSQPGHVRKWARDASRQIKARLAGKA